MNLPQLDDIIPKRWILLLRYYLPFCKKPAPFYFKCRQLINELKRTSPNHLFPLNSLPDLLFILDTYSKNDTDLIFVAKKIIALISPEQYQQNDHLLLKNILLKFDPENNQTVILNQLLLQIPAKAYKDIISLLTLSKNKIFELIKWCGRLADKFSLEDKLNLILSLPERLILNQKTLLYSLAFTELETRINPASGDMAKTLTCSEALVGFILKWQKYLNLSTQCLFRLFNQWLEAESQLFMSYINALDIDIRFTFFENLLASYNDTAKNNEKFLRLCPQAQRSLFINRLIDYLFKSFIPEAKETLILTRKPSDKNDPRLLILRNLLEDSSDYSLNPFQLLALISLTGEPLSLEKLKKIKLDAYFFLESAKSFPIELQEYVAESNIKTIKLFIRENIMPEVPDNNERYSIKKRLLDFFQDSYPNTDQDPVAALRTIIEKIPLKFESTLQILFTLLEPLYLLLKNPAIQSSKQKRFMAAEKVRCEAEERAEARRELKRRIASGQQSSISIQRMKELYGQEAETIQKIWQKKSVIQFFDANDEMALKAASREAKELIQLKREFSVSY
ncbi:MAG: hypothetical protein CFE62_002060 [Candidatus Aquirickettsiella gammari]|uniref:Uncharacterized protein n=1 Tax=Candidatus Aquirickettsiella gammari TaxID=2016198 RepID=A0A370CJW2_9COXI|nr:MAG: hypothetical protein CFE62_002060 [Candidatus Aquirickettsiella gammari]